MFVKQVHSSLVIAIVLTLVSACSGGGSSPSSESSEVSVCTKLREKIADIEDNANLNLRINPNAYPTSLELFGLESALTEAGVPSVYKSSYHRYVDVLNLLAAAESCFSDEALIYLNNFLETPLIKSIREQDGN
jgi:hypothetical protein